MIDGLEVLASHGSLKKNILIPPLLDRSQFLNGTLAPWISAAESTRGCLPISHQLVQAHLSELSLSSDGVSVPIELSKKIIDDGNWTMVGHVIDTKLENEVERMGGILGIGEDVDTVWDPEMLAFHLKKDDVKGGTFYLFMVPHWMVRENMPHLPLKVYSPEVVPNDLPASYLKSAERHFTDGTIQHIFDETKIVPLTFCLGKVRV